MWPDSEAGSCIGGRGEQWSLSFEAIDLMAHATVLVTLSTYIMNYNWLYEKYCFAATF